MPGIYGRRWKKSGTLAIIGGGVMLIAGALTFNFALMPAGAIVMMGGVAAVDRGINDFIEAVGEKAQCMESHNESLARGRELYEKRKREIGSGLAKEQQHKSGH